MDSVYHHENYRDFLLSALNGERDHGGRSRLAKAASCSPSWITRVLSGSVQLTPDQACSIAEYFELSERETDFFLLLVDRERAATPLLRKRLERRCAELRAESAQLSTEVKTDFSITEQHRVRYYSSWLFPSIHVACMIRPLSIDEVVGTLGVPRSAAASALGELLEMGLVAKNGTRWEATSKNIHLPSEHVLTDVMHASWRSRTTQVLQERGSGDGLHYSGVHCLSREDLQRIKNQLKEALLQARKTIEASPSEALAVFTLDFFEF